MTLIEAQAMAINGLWKELKITQEALRLAVIELGYKEEEAVKKVYDSLINKAEKTADLKMPGAQNESK